MTDTRNNLRRRKPFGLPQGRQGSAHSRAGFAVAPILYVLGLVGVGAGVLFSGYSQILHSNQSVTYDMQSKNDLQSAAQTMAASAAIGYNGSSQSILCPPRGPGASSYCNSTTAPLSIAAISGQTQLPKVSGGSAVTAAWLMTAGSPQEVGVFTASAGVPQLDPWGHYYLVCRWENLMSPGTGAAFMIIGAGPDGTVQTNCGQTAAQGDDYIVEWSVSTAVNRSTLWQQSGNSVSYGQTGSKLTVDQYGNLTVPGTIAVSSSAVFSSSVSAPTFTGSLVGGSVSGTSASFSGSGSFNAINTGTSNQFKIDTGGNVSTTGTLATGAATVTSLISGSGSFSTTLGVTGNTTLGGTLSVLSGATSLSTVSTTGLATLNSLSVTNGATVGGTLGVTGNTSLSTVSSSGLATLNSLAVTGAATVGGTLGVTGQLNGTTANFSGNVQAASFTGSVSGGSINWGSSVVPIANGGTGSTTAAAALAALGGTNASNLTSGTLGYQRLDTSGVSNNGGPFNSVFVDQYGRVTSASYSTSTSSSISDGSGDSVAVGTSSGGLLTFTIGGTLWNVMDKNGNLGIGTTAPRASIDAGNRTDAVYLPVGSSNQRPGTSYAGMLRYNSFLGQLEIYSGGAWNGLVMAGGGGGGISSGIYLGSSSTATNPQRSGDASTGLYSAGAGLVDVAISSNKVSEWSSTGQVLTGTLTATASSGTVVSGTNSGTSGSTYGVKGDTSANTTAGGYAVYANGNASGYGVYSAAGTNYFNGNVGLGTSTIANKLDVNGAASIGYPGIAGPTNGLLVNGNVGLGTAASYNPLTVVGNSTLTSSSYTAINLYGNQTVASTGNYYSVVASPAFTAASGNTLNYLYGITSGAYNASTGTITNLMGMYTAPNNASSGTVTTMYGLYAAPANNSAGDASGTVTTLVGVLGRPYNASHLATSINAMYGVQGTPTNNYTGTVNYMYGLYSQCVNSWTGTVSNCYALYLDTPNNGGTITNRFGVYQVDTASPNYFAGKIGIGSTTPVSSLDLNMQTDALALPVGTTGQRPGVPVNGMMRYNNSTSPPQLEAYANNAWTQIFTGNNAQWSTNGTSIYYNGGNVGIGTNNPLNKLDVAGGVVIGTANAGIKTAPTNGLLVQGNVGLGITTSPTQMVELGSSAPGAIGPVVKLRNTGNSTSDQAYVDFATGSATDTSEVRARIGMNVLTGGQGQFDIYTKSTATTFGAAPDMRIVSGKVGIGTATVGAGLLTIGSTAGTSGSIVLNGSTSGNATIQVPAVAGTGTLFQLPATNGNNGYVLQTDGTGVTTWTNTPAGLITTLGTSTGAANPRISGDATSGFYTAGAGLVDVTISSTKRVEWSSTGEAVTGQMSTTGSVGVGTSTIANKLDVNGSASIGYVNTAAPSNGLLVSGSVGIGSASPTYTLDMATSSTSGLRIRNGTATSAAGMAIANDGTNGLSFASYGSTYSAGSIFSVGAGGSGISSSGGSFGIGTGDSNNFYLGTSNSPRMTIASSGRIGIGTTSPSYVLDILSTTTNSFRVNNTSSTSASTMQFTNDQNNGLGIAAYGSTYSAGSVFSIGANGTGLTSTGGTFGLGTYDSNNLLLGTNNTVRMTILSGGNVGIGTATVANKLDVNGAASIGYINTAAPSNGLIVSGQMGVGTATSLGGAQLSVVGNTIYTATVSTTDVFPTLGKQPLMALVGAGTVNGNPNIGLLQVNIGSSNVYQSASEIYLAATRGLTANTRSAVANTDILGQVGFFGDDGTNVRTRGAMIQSFVDTSVDPVATGNIPARLVLATEMHAPIVFNTNAGTLSADVTTNERMRIDGYGNVGIGSTAPATLLDVNGAATIRGNLTVTGTVTGGAVSVTLGTSAASPTPSRSGESNTGLFSPTSGAVAVSSLSNEMMRVNATGVGIGTTTIANKLDVNGAVSIGYLNTATTSNSLIVSNAIGVGTTTPLYPLDVNGMVQSRTGGFQIVNPNNANASASLSWYNDGTNDWPRIRYGGTGSGSGTGFQIQGSGNAVKFTVLDSGNVGIGTTAPIGLLNVYGTGGSGQIYWGSTGAVGSLFAGAGNAGVGTYNNYPLIFWTNNSAAQMTLSTAGYLGIGTTAPTSLLSVYGGGLAVGTYAATANVGVGSAVFSGNVGVGQASPAYPLDVETSGGTNAIYGSSNGVANGVGVYGNATGSSGKGVYGNGAFGVYGSGTTYGVDGASTSGTGVYANTTSGYGVQGTAIGTTGTNYGVWGNSASSGGYGVYGTNTSSGIGGYFSSTSGYALVTNTGNVGIGSTTPATLLDVNGATTIRGNLTVTGTCTGCGGGGGSSTLGTAIGSSSPYRSGDTTTGLYTAGAGLVDVAASNTQAVEFSSTKVNIPLTTAASSTATGALVVAGGAGIGGSLYSGAHVVSVASGTGISGTNTGASGTTYGLKGDTSANTTTGGYAVYANGNASGYGVYSAAGLNYFNGNVGVGTASPGVPLDVAGYARVYSATQFRGFVVNNTTNNVAILQGGSATNDNGQLSLSNAGTAGIFLTASGSSYLNGGNVGIGTTAPSAALDSMSATTAAIFENPVTNTSYSGGTPVWVRNSGTATNNNYLLFTEGWNGSSGTNFGSLSFGANSSFTIANPSGNAVALQPSSGNVGIGTTSPDFNLTVQGGGSNNIHIKNANTDVGWGFSSDSTTGRLIINEPNVAERVSILTNGNVGIGTVNPQMGLHVYNTTNWGQLLLEGNNNGVALNIKNDGTGGNQWQIASTNNASTYGAGDLVFALLNSNTIVNMQTNGGMLLGTTYASGSTTAPANGLAVQGSVGIGTVGPTNVFTVDKAATTAATASTYHEAVNISGLNYLTMGANSSYALIQSWQSLPLYLNSQGNNVLIGGNVGIGTTSPTGVLNVNGGANSPIVRVEGTSNPVMTVLDDSGTNGELILGVVTSGGSYSNVASAGDAVVRTGLNAAGAGGNLILTSRTATGNIMFATQAPDTTKMIITNAGNVGIGTTSPATLLDVNGAATIRGNLTITGTCTGCGSGSLSWPLAGAADTVSAPDYAWSGHTNTGLYYNTGVGFTVGGSGVGTFTSSGLQLANVYSNGGPLYINNVTPNNTYLNGGGGYVGIGANSASYTLDVNGTIADRGSRFETGLDGTNTFWIGNVSGSEPNNLAMGYNTNGSGTVQTLQFATAGSTRMVVNSSGNVGIGSATPRYNLDVNGNIYSDGSAIGSWSNALGIAQGGNVNYMQVDASGNTYFASNHSASFEFMGGNVGIGTTSPGVTLEVNGEGRFVSPNNGTTGAVVIRDNASNTGAYLQFVNNAVSNQYSYIQGLSSGGLALMGGNVGVGVSSPPYTLTVAPGGTGSGLGVGWNKSAGSGETDFYNYGQGGAGGFQFWNYYNPGSTFPTTGSTNLMTMTSGGNIGIGTTVPSQLLHVYSGSTNAKIALDAPAASNPTLQFLSAGTPKFGIYRKAGTNDLVADSDLVSPILYLQETGNVGIGTSAPGNLFTLYGADSSNAGPHFRVMTAADTTYPIFQQLNWSHNNISLNFDAYYNNGWLSASSGSNFQIYKTNNQLQFNYGSGVTAGASVPWSNGIVLNSSGNVGIGTTDPSLGGSVSSKFTIVSSSTLFAGAYSNTQLAYALNTTNTGAWTMYDHAASSGTAWTAGISETSGNVGIGLTTPAYKLEVNGDARVDGWMRTQGVTGWYSDTYGGGWFMQDSTWIRSYGSKPVFMSNGYDSGAASGVNCGGGLGGGYTLQVCGGSGVLAVGYYLSSDMRLKHDIQAAHKGLAAVDGLRTVTFRWNDTNKDDYGVIAQEVQKVLPEVIGHRDDGMLSVQYDKLVLPVIEAVKELHAMIVDLEAKVAGLLQWQSDTDKRLDAMQAEIQALKAANDNLAHQNDELRKLVTGAQKK